MRSRDLRAIARLCAETAEVQASAAAVEHFLHGSARLMGADVVSLFGIHVEHTWYRAGAGVIRGFDDSQIALLQKWYFDSSEPIRCPLNEEMYRQGHPHAVRSRRRLIDDRSWYRHPHTNERAAQLGLDDVLVASIWLEHRLASAALPGETFLKPKNSVSVRTFCAGSSWRGAGSWRVRRYCGDGWRIG